MTILRASAQSITLRGLPEAILRRAHLCIGSLPCFSALLAASASIERRSPRPRRESPRPPSLLPLSHTRGFKPT